MTRDQLRLCKFVQKYRRLDKIMKHAGLTHEDELQDRLFPDVIIDYEDPNKPDTEVILPSHAIAELEKFERERRYWMIPLILSIIALVLSVVAILATITEDSLLWKFLKLTLAAQ